jgi:hypothetical protein
MPGFKSTHRYIALIVLAAGFALTAPVAAAEKPFWPAYLVWVQRDVMVPMRDGVVLATDLYRPVGMLKGPVILVRTPYGKRGQGKLGFASDILMVSIAARGYTVAVQDCRGRFKSQGEFYPFVAEEADGKDTLAWLAKQNWSNDAVGTWGGSYFGFTQWALADGDPRPRAESTLVTTADIRQIYYEGGAINLQNILGWGADNYAIGRNISFKPEDLLAGYRTLPLADADRRVVGEDIPFVDDTFTYRTTAVLAACAYEERMKKVSGPVFSTAGWYDLFQKFQIEDFMRLRAVAAEPARSMSRMVIGPWGHGVFADPPVKFPDGGMEQLPQLGKLMSFYDQFLYGRDRGVQDWPVYTVYVMGANRWVGLEQWPPADMVPTSYYFHSGGAANTAGGDGALSVAAPGAEPTDSFIYDPADPVPTAGGPLLGADLGPKLQGPVEARSDVLVYTTAALTSPLTAMGPIKLVLYAASDAPDTDFTAKLCDVFPDGRSVNINDGIVRARFRAGDLSRPEPIAPGQVYRYEIDLWHTAYVFSPGHRIRVQISSSNFPRFDRNLNTGADIALGTEIKKARQTIYHQPERASALVLPVVKNID